MSSMTTRCSSPLFEDDLLIQTYNPTFELKCCYQSNSSGTYKLEHGWHHVAFGHRCPTPRHSPNTGQGKRTTDQERPIIQVQSSSGGICPDFCSFHINEYHSMMSVGQRAVPIPL